MKKSKIPLLFALSFISVNSLGEETEAPPSRWSVSVTASEFYDGNVAESVIYNSTSVGQEGGPEGGGPGGGQGGGGGGHSYIPSMPKPIASTGSTLHSLGATNNLSAGPGNQGQTQGQIPGPSYVAPIGSVYTDWGQKAEGDFGYKFYISGKNTWSALVTAYGVFYNLYTDYNYESYIGSLKYEHEGSSIDFSSTFSYVNTYYNDVYSQDYVRWEPEFTWKTNSPVLDWYFCFNQYARTYMNSWNGSSTFTVKFPGEVNTFKLSGTGTYAYGDVATYANGAPGQPFTLASGVTFSRYTSYSGAAEYDRSWSDHWGSVLKASYTTTNYNPENLPQQLGPGVSNGARSDRNTVYEVDMKYVLQPDHWTSTLGATYTSNASTGFQGVPSTSGNPSDTYYRPFYTLSVEYDM